MDSRKTLLFLLIIFSTVILFQNTNSNFLINRVVAENKFEVIPHEFVVQVPITRIDKLPTYSIQLISTEDINNASVVFSSLSSQEAGKMWIPRQAITAVPPVFNLTHGRVTNVDILLKLPNQTGSYRGTVTFSAPDRILDIIDTKIDIFDPIPVVSIIAVAAGVIVAFILKNLKTRMAVRSSALEVIEKFRTSCLNANRDGRVDANFRTGNEEAKRALSYFTAGDFEYAKQAMENAIGNINSAKTPLGAPVQGLKGKFFNEMFDQVRKKGGLMSLFKQQNSIIFLLTSSAVFIVILETWLQVYNQIQSSGESFLGIIVAFLLGYGTQSLLGEAFDTKPQQ